MSDSRKAIADDEDDYLRLCKKYGENAEYTTHKGRVFLDCYGEHARKLEQIDRVARRLDR